MKHFPSVNYSPFPKVPRLKRDCVITEKIDGTNACVYIEDGQAFAGSRKRWLAPEGTVLADVEQLPDTDPVYKKGTDNHAFAQWVKANEEELVRGLSNGYHFGEWYGQGIQRAYGLEEKRFALFNVGRWADGNQPACCEVVPVLYQGDFSTYAVNAALEAHQLIGSSAVPGWMDVEGIMVYMTASAHLYKVTVDDRHKESAR